MSELREAYRAGLPYLEAVSSLLQRIRAAHPTAGLYEAADLQWWWAQRPRPSEELPQLFWFDYLDRPAAAVVASESGGEVQLDPIVMPDASPEWVASVMEGGLAHALKSGFEVVRLEVDRADDTLRRVLIQQGFETTGGGLVETWMASHDRPEISPLNDDYRLATRLQSMGRPHHMIKRNGAEIEARLRQTSLYRPELDLVVYDLDDSVAAYGLFWYDPFTATGLVEPMRTEDNHQRLGLARHILTTGVELLTQAGAERIKICFEPNNPASSHLYLSVGFKPDRDTLVLTGPTSR